MELEGVQGSLIYPTMNFNPFRATRRYKRHQNKVKVKGLGKNSSYLAGISIFFHGKSSISWLKKKRKKKKKKKTKFSSRA